MIVLSARNVNYALPQGVTHLHQFGVREDSRNGPVLRELMPVTTEYMAPLERVCHHPWRDANPFFHLIEAMWMLAGRDDIKTLQRYVKSFNYTDDGSTVPGAYGKRWRAWDAGTPGGGEDPAPGAPYSWPDQLDWAARRLRDNPQDRRVVIQMWDPGVDIGRADDNSKDVPCNLTVLPFMTGDELNITVFCRSNDMVWGAYGANAVHFSFLLEYLAARIGARAGKYWQVSNNFHAYLETAGDPQACWPVDWGPVDPYARGIVRPLPMGTSEEHDLSTEKGAANFDHWLKVLFDHGAGAVSGSGWAFLDKVVVPMASAHEHYRKNKGEDRYTGAQEILQQMPAGNDWLLAASEWVARREEAWRAKQ